MASVRTGPFGWGRTAARALFDLIKGGTAGDILTTRSEKT